MVEYPILLKAWKEIPLSANCLRIISMTGFSGLGLGCNGVASNLKRQWSSRFVLSIIFRLEREKRKGRSWTSAKSRSPRSQHLLVFSQCLNTHSGNDQGSESFLQGSYCSVITSDWEASASQNDSLIASHFMRRYERVAIAASLMCLFFKAEKSRDYSRMYEDTSEGVTKYL